MKIKQGMRYYLREFGRASLIYYGIVVLLFLATLIVSRALGEHNITVNGMDTASLIFVFVLGLNAFKSEFGLFVQNGISRRTLWVDFLLSAGVLCLAMALIDSCYPLIFGRSLQYDSLFGTLYNRIPSFASGAAAAHGGFVAVLWLVLAYLSAISFGFFITTLFYRMSKPLKVIVSVGVPVLLFVVMPIIEVFVPSFTLFTTLIRFYSWAMGLGILETFPLRAIASMGVFTAAMAALGFLLIRRVTLKTT